MPKLLWVAMPLLLAAAALALAWWRGRLLPRPVLNAWLSLLLLAYLVGTAALGLFWVAAQQLPVFDWHYLFGYATVLLVAVHLVFNLRSAWRVLRRPASPRRPPAAARNADAETARRRPVLAAVAGATAAASLGFWFGRRQGQGEVAWDGDAHAGPSAAVRRSSATAAMSDATGVAGAEGATDTTDRGLKLVEHYHAMSSHTRGRLWQQAPPVAWGAAPPPHKPWPAGAVRLALPTSGTAAAPGLAALGTVLWHGAGISAQRGGLALRASPSSGGLFSTELYVIARRVPGLAPGAWHYRPEAQALLRVGDARRNGVAEKLADGLADGLAGDPDALLVATAVFRRTGHKYRDRCYRYVLADLGHALENLRVAAAALRWPAVLLSRFAEAELAVALAIADEAEEGVLAVIRLGAADGAPASAAPNAAAPSAPAEAAAPLAAADATLRSSRNAAAPLRVPSAATPSRMPSAAWPAGGSSAASPSAEATTPPAAAPRRFGPAVGLDREASRPLALGATAALHRASSLRKLPAASSGAPRAASAAPAGPPGLPLPRVTPAQADPLATIARRRSVRRFAATPLPLPALSAVLQALMLDRPALLSAAVRADVVVNAVDGLAPGAYRYRPPDHALLPRRSGDLRAAARAAALDQDVIGDAAAVLVLSIDRATLAADASGAARGYRHAFLEAGLVGERLYLEAVARGLGACAVGAFHDDEAAALVAADPAREWVVHFAALGPLTA
jgi:SagB-type dehydrogenase family enzyme